MAIDDRATRHLHGMGGAATPDEVSRTGYTEIPIVRRMNYFWLAVVAAMLVGGCASASADDPRLWHTWRGPAILALSLAFIGWYLLLTCVRPRHRWPLPRRTIYPWLAAGFVITALLLYFDRGFLGLTYALMGMSSILPLAEATLPTGIAALMLARSLGALPPYAVGHSWTDMLGALFSIGLGVGITISLSVLIRQRYQLEHVVRELREAQRQLLLSSAREVELAALRERNRLAREMHDSLGHALVLIAVKIEAAQRLQAVDPTRAAAEWEGTKALVRATMSDLRASLAGLRLPVLDEQPFDVALAALAEETGRRAAIEVSVAIASEAMALNRQVQETLYRVAQEALTNVAKHAGATHAQLILALRDSAVQLEVADDGVGLGAAPRSGSGHYGVLGMSERVEALGGVLTLGPQSQGGTLLHASIPLAECAAVRDPRAVG